MSRADVPKQRRTAARNSISLDKVRWHLARLWFGMAAPIFLLLVIQSIFGKYQGRVQAVWSWALPTMMPSLALIITVLGADAMGSEDGKTKVKKPFYLVAFWLSAFYLFLVLATILIEPFTPFDSLALLNLSNLWLGPFQGLVASALAVLFFSKRAKES